MKYEVRIRPEAQIEFSQSVDWYEDRQLGLGSRFIESVDVAIKAISEFPEQSPRVYRDIRCKSVKRFPYQIYYRILKQDIVEILSIFHVRQYPGVWQSRN